MDSLFFHPRVVHLPMGLSIIMPLVALGLVVAWWQKWLPSRAWLIAVALQGILSVSALVALRTGEAEEDKVEELVGHDVIHEHEDAAKLFFGGSVVVLGLMVGGLVLAQRKSGFWLAAGSAVGTVAVLGLGVRTGHAGGALVYDHGAAQVYVSPKATPSKQPAEMRAEPETHRE